jgi:cysteine desulfurase / selenocysteine lyase
MALLALFTPPSSYVIEGIFVSYASAIRSESALTPMLNVREQIVGLELDVPLLNGSRQPAINFDNAASTPALRPVLDTVNEFVAWYSSVHRGSGFKSQLSTRVYEEARHVVGQFFGARSDQHVVIFGKNTTEAINKLARRIPFRRGEIVLTSLQEHHSNDLPWRAVAEVKHIDVDAAGHLDEEHFAALLSSFGRRIRLVAISGGSNVTGAIAPIHRLAELAHAVGAEIFVDCAQLAPHRPIDIGALDDPCHLDYIAISGHKLYAPFGTGALIGRRNTFDQGTPEYVGGGTVATVTRSAVTWATTPDRDEAGSPNVVGAVALAAALQWLSEIGMEQVAAHEAELTAYALERLAQIPGLQLHGQHDPATAVHRLGVLPFSIDGISHRTVAAILSAEHGIAVRSGSFCAQPYLRHVLELEDADLSCESSPAQNSDRLGMAGLVRVSFGIYNTLTEIDVLADALQAIARGAYHGRYIQDLATGDIWPEGWMPPTISAFSLHRGA